MILIFLTVNYGFSIYYSQAEDCVKGNHGLARFGPTCEYLCHCGTNQCDRVTGTCPYNGECDGGWMGSGCQYANIAYNTTVHSNHLCNTSTIVDGRRDSCPYETKPITNPAYVMVSFGREVKITAVNIVCSNSVDVPRPFAVSVYDGNKLVLCGSVDYTNGQKEYVIKCNYTLYGQYLNITYQWSAGFKVCEIQVSAGRNVAYGKPAIQSSLVELFYASNAVDGRTYHDLPWLTCTHTMDSTGPWWLLDLQASFMIQWFKIFNRPDNNQDYSLNERLRNFRILLSQDIRTFYQYYEDQNNGSNDPPLVIEKVLKPDVLAQFVKIDLPGTNRILSLCEVQVFGECVHGYYGSKCNMSCIHCKNLDCDKITGRCHSCVAGRQGDLCQIACADNYYGNCSTRCGHCKDSSVCNKVNGSCASGSCSEGWEGDKCNIECNSTYYGQNCSQPCGHCLDNTCDRFNGNCSENGCEPGWQGSRCDIITCADNYYGNCSTRCGHCKDSSVCNKVNGSCVSGSCSEGWERDNCNIECNSTYYGQNCSQPCGHCLDNTCDRFNGNCSENGCEPGWQGSRCDIIIAIDFQQQTVTDTNVVAIGASVGTAVSTVAIIITIVIFITVKRRSRKRDTMERNTTTMEMSPNSGNVAVINADTPIPIFDITTIENPRAYYNIEELNQNQSGSTNITSINVTVKVDVNLYSHYEKLKHHTGATESTYSAIDHSQSGHHNELLYGANLDESNAYYNIVQSTTVEEKDSH